MEHFDMQPISSSLESLTNGMNPLRNLGREELISPAVFG